MSDDKPQIGRITFYDGSDYKPTEIPPLAVSLSGQNKLGTTLRAYEKRIAELEAALRDIQIACVAHNAELRIFECRYCEISCHEDNLLSMEHSSDCVYVKAQGLLGDANDSKIPLRPKETFEANIEVTDIQEGKPSSLFGKDDE